MKQKPYKQYIYLEARQVEDEIVFWYARVGSTTEAGAYVKGAKEAGKRGLVMGTFLNDIVIPLREAKREAAGAE